ncbi:hypothetical protein [Pleomorphomonas koreensis]|uniref:hypothetical protein n=1 Tax=Pleomorphomonas koreensis TaxID=257440 RepID=UPI0004200AAC|nr:hypothetical protein [Pleomorphomonas koreensis]
MTDDLTCRPALRYHALRAAIWDALGMPPQSTDAELIDAVRSLRQRVPGDDDGNRALSDGGADHG